MNSVDPPTMLPRYVIRVTAFVVIGRSRQYPRESGYEESAYGDLLANIESLMQASNLAEVSPIFGDPFLLCGELLLD